MLTIVFPERLNWFYSRQAKLISEDLQRLNVDVVAVAAGDLDRLENCHGDALILSLAESMADVERDGLEEKLGRCLRRFRRRVLLNYDGLTTHFFRRHFAFGPRLITEIIDIGCAPQTTLELVYGVPYRWMPECFTAHEVEILKPWSAGRPLPWVMIGHTNSDRAALAAACVQAIHPGGFLFMPQIRPFDGDTDFGGQQLSGVLGKADLYIWGSHHSAPYHEGLRALHAIAAGAVPAKIDPLHYEFFAELPWVYDSLRSLLERRERFGLDGLYRQAADFLLGAGLLGEQLLLALSATDSNKLPAAQLLAH